MDGGFKHQLGLDDPAKTPFVKKLSFMSGAALMQHLLVSVSSPKCNFQGNMSIDLGSPETTLTWGTGPQLKPVVTPSP